MRSVLTRILPFLLLGCLKQSGGEKAVQKAVQTTPAARGAGLDEGSEGAAKTPAQTIKEIYGKSYAVVIGIDDYAHDGAKLKDLQGAFQLMMV